MIKRKIPKDGNQYQSINEDSFTNKKGIDVTQAPPMRDFVFNAENLDVNLDGSMSLRKPLGFYTGRISEYYTKELYDKVHYLYIEEDAEEQVYVPYIGPGDPDEWSIIIKYNDNSYNYFDNYTYIDLSKAKILNTATSSILYNVKITDLSSFLDSDVPASTLFNECWAYFRVTIDAENNTLYLEYIDPYIANITSVEGEPSFNPNVAGYYTYALKDTYNAAVNKVNGVMAYKSTNITDSMSVRNLTETANYQNYIIEVFGEDFAENVMLKAFCDFNTKDLDIYCTWEETSDGVVYNEINPSGFDTVLLKVPDFTKSEETLNSSTRTYKIKNVIPLKNLADSNFNLIRNRPDVLSLTNFNIRKSYKFTLYGLDYSNSGLVSYTEKSITTLNGVPFSNFTLRTVPVRYCYTDTNYEATLKNQDFSMTYTVSEDLDLSQLSVWFKFKNRYDLSDTEFEVQNINVSSVSLTSTTKSITISSSRLQSTIGSIASTNYICNINQCLITILINGEVFDSTKYNIVDVLGLPNSIGGTIPFALTARHWEFPELSSSNIDYIAVTGTVDYSDYYIKDGNNYVLASNITSRLVRSAQIMFNAIDDGLFSLSSLRTLKKMRINMFGHTYMIIGSDDSHAENWFYVDLYTTTINGKTLNIINGLYPERMKLDTGYSTTVPFILAGNNEYVIDDSTYSLSRVMTILKNGTTNVIADNNNLTFTGSTSIVFNGYEISNQTFTPFVSDKTELLDKDFVNTVGGEKLYYNYKIYTYGDDYKNNIYVSDSNSFITSLLNTIDLPMSNESKITALVPWRDYLIAASETNLFLITHQGGNNYTSKCINTFIGIPKKDRKTLKAILNGVVFKSGNKVYSVQPSMYASNDSILNIVDISKPITPYLVDGDEDNFAFTTEQFYFLCIPGVNEDCTVLLKYEYATRIWTKHYYDEVFRSEWMNTINDIKMICRNAIYYFDKSVDELLEIYPNADSLRIQYGDLTGTNNVTPFEFSLDTGQKSYSMNLVKQFVESKLIFAILGQNDDLPLTVDVYIDQYRPVLHQDVNSSSSFWKKLDTSVVSYAPISSLALGAPIPATEENTTQIVVDTPVIKQLFLRYSGKGYTIRHVISGKSHNQFKFYVSYYRYKPTSNKQ